MRTALYYPHTEVQSESLVRTALLTWDSLEYIAPDAGYQPQYESKSMARAMELIGKRRVPTTEEKETIHELVEDLLKQVWSFLAGFSERLEPIQEEWIQGQLLSLVSRLSMRRIIATRTNAATVVA